MLERCHEKALYSYMRGSQYREPLRGSIELLTGVVSLLQTFKIAKVNRKTTSISTIQTP